MTCNDCGREIGDCDRNGCREVRGTAWEEWSLAMAKKEPDCDITVGGEQPTPADGGDSMDNIDHIIRVVHSWDMNSPRNHYQSWIWQLVSEIERQRAKIDVLKEEDRQWDKHGLVQVITQNQRLREYARHKPECQRQGFLQCTCGYAEFYASLTATANSGEVK